MLNKSKGNMYPWVTHTWNVIKGKCPHDCSYCYMKRYPQPELHLDEKELKTDLGSGNFIFVGSSCDMWARGVPTWWIESVLLHCLTFEGNRYLFQSKYPARFRGFVLPANMTLGTTIESNRRALDLTANVPDTRLRYTAMAGLRPPKMVSIEPIMDFDLEELVRWMENIGPEFVSIGADSGNNHLPEPSPDKVKSLIKALGDFTEVRAKKNLERLMN